MHPAKYAVATPDRLACVMSGSVRRPLPVSLRTEPIRAHDCFDFSVLNRGDGVAVLMDNSPHFLEIEELVITHPDVADMAVISIPDE